MAYPGLINKSDDKLHPAAGKLKTFLPTPDKRHSRNLGFGTGHIPLMRISRELAQIIAYQPVTGTNPSILARYLRTSG